MGKPPRRLMRPLVALLLVLAALLSGCHGIGDDRFRFEAPEDPEPGADPGPEGPGEDLGANATGEGGDGNTTAPPSQNEEGEERELACHEQSPRAVVPPTEQRVESAADILCPGHYAITANGSGTAWTPPVWETGDWWRYRDVWYGTTCDREYTIEVTGTGTTHGVDVYQIKETTYDCSGNHIRDTTKNLTKDHRTAVQGSGFIFHEQLFSVKSGMKWKTMLLAGGLADARAELIPDYVSPFGAIEAWKLHVEWSSYGNQDAWWGTEIGNAVVIERSNALQRVELIDWHGNDDGDLPLPFP
jgi:hypothetical protein